LKFGVVEQAIVQVMQTIAKMIYTVIDGDFIVINVKNTKASELAMST
jgi:hypothetical protein